MFIKTLPLRKAFSFLALVKLNSDDQAEPNFKKAKR